MLHGEGFAVVVPPFREGNFHHRVTQYTATRGGMDPTPLSELMNNCKLECEQGW